MAGEFFSGLFNFVSYALGMGDGAHDFDDQHCSVQRGCQRLCKETDAWVRRLTPILVILAGLFIIAYWLTIGGLGEHIPLIPGSETFVEEVISLVSNNGESVISALPVAHSFGAGMIATINPCGFALLPAYLSLFLEGPSWKQPGGKFQGRRASLPQTSDPRHLPAVVPTLILS